MQAALWLTGHVNWGEKTISVLNIASHRGAKRHEDGDWALYILSRLKTNAIYERFKRIFETKWDESAESTADSYNISLCMHATRSKRSLSISRIDLLAERVRGDEAVAHHMQNDFFQRIPRSPVELSYSNRTHLNALFKFFLSLHPCGLIICVYLKRRPEKKNSLSRWSQKNVRRKNALEINSLDNRLIILLIINSNGWRLI